MVDGSGARSLYRLVLGAPLAQLGDRPPPRNAEDCFLFLPLGYGSSDNSRPGAPAMADAVFPDWPGTDDDRATAIGQCVASVVRYAREVDSLAEVRGALLRWRLHEAFIIAPLRQLREEAP